MHTLILTCSTGGGHNSCAMAIQEMLVEKGEVCEVLDCLELISQNTARFLSWGHTFMYRHFPWLFRWGYTMAEKHPKAFEEGSAVFRFFARGAEDLRKRIGENHIDWVVCTHPFGGLMMTAAKQRYALTVRTAFIVTDYTCSPSVQQLDMDYFCIPHESLTEEFLCPNIPREKIIATGIPIRQVFFQRKMPARAKKELGIDPKNKHIVIMCGSMGCGPIRDLTDQLLYDLPSNVEMTILCGTNKKLFQDLLWKYRRVPRIHIQGYTSDVSSILDSADLYLTKPGGISVTEAAAKRLPMVLIDAVSGCEDHNAKFFCQAGCAVMEKNVESLSLRCHTIITNEYHQAQMSCAYFNLKLPNFSQTVHSVKG